MAEEAPTEVEKLCEYLRRELRNHARTPLLTRRTTYKTIDMLTEEVCAGVRLRDVMAPKVAFKEWDRAESVFDAWLWPAFKPGEGLNQKHELREVAGDDVLAYVERGDTLGEKAVRLLYVLGRHEDVELILTPDTISCKQGGVPFGISKGVVFSRFCHGMELEVDHMSILKGGNPCRVFDTEFCSLYREAYRLHLERPLIALHMGNPNRIFKAVAGKAYQPKVMTDAKRRRIERILVNDHDPLSGAYKQLVPEFMEENDFKKVFGVLTDRNLTPNNEQRQLLLTNLAEFHHKKKKENNETDRNNGTGPKR